MALTDAGKDAILEKVIPIAKKLQAEQPLALPQSDTPPEWFTQGEEPYDSQAEEHTEQRYDIVKLFPRWNDILNCKSEGDLRKLFAPFEAEVMKLDDRYMAIGSELLYAGMSRRIISQLRLPVVGLNIRNDKLASENEGSSMRDKGAGHTEAGYISPLLPRFENVTPNPEWMVAAKDEYDRLQDALLRRNEMMTGEKKSLEVISELEEENARLRKELEGLKTSKTENSVPLLESDEVSGD